MTINVIDAPMSLRYRCGYPCIMEVNIYAN